MLGERWQCAGVEVAVCWDRVEVAVCWDWVEVAVCWGRGGSMLG